MELLFRAVFYTLNGLSAVVFLFSFLFSLKSQPPVLSRKYRYYTQRSEDSALSSFVFFFLDSNISLFLSFCIKNFSKIITVKVSLVCPRFRKNVLLLL